MEELRKLQRVQSILSTIETEGLSTNDHDSDRFIANFVLFMGQQCGVLDIQKRCNLLYELLSKVSIVSLYSLLQSVMKEGLEVNQNASGCRIYPENFSQHHLVGISNDKIFNQIEDQAAIKFGAMQQASSTLEDFCRSYFMFHGMDSSNAQTIFFSLPLLYFTEGYIYQLDSLNEKQLLQSAVYEDLENFSPQCPTSNPFDPLIHILQQQKVMTERIGNELNFGIEYWKLERKLCDGLDKKTMIQTDDVMRAIHLKSFDYRVLNLLLYQLRGQPVNELHMEFLSLSEFLVEVSDDLYDYEEDVIDNTFNILRMFVAMYGPAEAPVMLAKRITEAEENYRRLSAALDPDLSSSFWKRCEEATREGCSAPGDASFGKWTIPSVIVDEESFRLQAGFFKQCN